MVGKNLKDKLYPNNKFQCFYAFAFREPNTLNALSLNHYFTYKPNTLNALYLNH